VKKLNQFCGKTVGIASIVVYLLAEFVKLVQIAELPSKARESGRNNKAKINGAVPKRFDNASAGKHH
jgi:hypothetical protein